MRHQTTFFAKAGALLVLLTGLALAPQSYAGGEMPSKKACKKPSSTVMKGGCIMTDRKKGNCMACHQFKGLKKTRLQAGNVAPPLVAIKQRFPKKATLRGRVWDGTKVNRNSSMPPFGRHKILTESEIDSIVEFLYTL